MKQQTDEKNIAVNRKARHEFAIIQTFETGIVLVGTEAVSYTHLRAHETVLDIVCRLLLEKNTNN